MHHSINIEKLADISYRGARRAAVFLGLGVNAARDPDFRQYELNHLSLIQATPPNLSHEQVDEFKGHFEDWIVRNALREIIESFDLFLEKLHHSCLLIGTAKGCVEEDEANRWGKKLHYGGVDDKLKLLRKRFGVTTEKEAYFQAITQARNCVTHRRSVVGAKDADDNGELHLKWWRIGRMFIKRDSGREIEIAPPFPEGGIQLEEAGKVCIKFTNNERTFKVGDPIIFKPEDILEICELTKLATSELLKSFVTFAQDKGVELREPPKPEHTQ